MARKYHDPRHTIRAFIAVPVNSELKRALAQPLADLQRVDAPVKWVLPEQMHLTVKFLGEVDWLQVGAIGKAMQDACAEIAAADLVVRGIQAFPPDRSPRVVAAGLYEGSEHLVELHRILDERLDLDVGLPPEGRRFKPHLTLGRVKSRQGTEKLWKRAEAYAETVFGKLPLDQLILMQSELLPRNARYTPLATARLT
jgi:2'-5' RNA ligase